jgi:hypothetical protein
MSDDPETARQIAELALDSRPLLVLDVDDVLLEFVGPFTRYIQSNEHEIAFGSFRLRGNIKHRPSGELASDERVAQFIADFFAAQADWQIEVDGAAEAVAGLARHAEIVLLTAMPHAHRSVRRELLDSLGFPYPLLTTETAKGPAIRALRGDHPRPVAFVDDIPRNLLSARESVADAHLFNLMAMPSLRQLLPPLPADVAIVDRWPEAAPMIATALGFAR